MQKAPWLEKKKIIHWVKNESQKQKRLNQIVDFVKEADGINYAERVMNDYLDKALTMLDDFKDSEYKTYLNDLVHFTIERTK